MSVRRAAWSLNGIGVALLPLWLFVPPIFALPFRAGASVIPLARRASRGTQVRLVQPTNAAGVLLPAYRVTRTVRAEGCGGSIVVADGYRCGSTAAEGYDPCWPNASTASAATVVYCLLQPWSTRVTKMLLSDPLEAITPEAGGVWGLELSSRRRCIAIQSTTTMYHGERIGFDCGADLELLGRPMPGRPFWHVREVSSRPSGGSYAHRLGPIARVAVVWYGGTTT
jgi:hypothetical protein